MPQKVMIHVHGNLPDAARPTVGNGLRARQLGAALAARGIAVRYLTHARFYSAGDPPAELSLFDSAAAFLRLIQADPPDLLVLIQGEGLEMIPEADFDVPVLADWIAPRLLEFAFQDLPLEEWLFRVLASMAKADYHACCTETQRAYLYAMLQLAGADLSRTSVAVVPLAATAELPTRPPAAGPDPVFVAGGIQWPWIRSARFLRLLLEEMDAAGRGVLKIFGGRYPFGIDSSRYGDAAEALPHSARLQIRGLRPYPELLREYAAADVAVDLFEENPERHLALSFREIDYLLCGLPLVCAPFSHVAGHVRQYGAGWVAPALADEAVRRLFREILALPRPMPASYAAAAQRLVREEFDPGRAIRPVLDILAGPPRKAPRGASLLCSSILWADAARAELDKLSRETRALRDELAARERDLIVFRGMQEEKDHDLAASAATIEELRRYVADKEADLGRSVGLIGEKDQALGYQQATIARLEEQIGHLDGELGQAREQFQSASVRFHEETARAGDQIHALESALHNIQSRFLYRVYRKLTGK